MPNNEYEFKNIPRASLTVEQQPIPTADNRVVEWSHLYNEEQITTNPNLLFLFADTREIKYREGVDSPLAYFKLRPGSQVAMGRRFDRVRADGSGGNMIAMAIENCADISTEKFRDFIKRQFRPLKNWVRSGGCVVIPSKSRGTAKITRNHDTLRILQASGKLRIIQHEIRELIILGKEDCTYVESAERKRLLYGMQEKQRQGYQRWGIEQPRSSDDSPLIQDINRFGLREGNRVVRWNLPISFVKDALLSDPNVLFLFADTPQNLYSGKVGGVLADHIGDYQGDNLISIPLIFNDDDIPSLDEFQYLIKKIFKPIIEYVRQGGYLKILPFVHHSLSFHHSHSPAGPVFFFELNLSGDKGLFERISKATQEAKRQGVTQKKYVGSLKKFVLPRFMRGIAHELTTAGHESVIDTPDLPALIEGLNNNILKDAMFFTLLEENIRSFLNPYRVFESHVKAGEMVLAREEFDRLLALRLERFPELRILNHVDYNDKTLLGHAVHYKQLVFVQRLGEEGADFNQANDMGVTVLHQMAVTYKALQGELAPHEPKIIETQIAEAVVAKIGSVLTKDRRGNTPLHLSAGSNNVAALRWFLKQSRLFSDTYPLQIENDAGYTVIGIAIITKHLETLKTILLFAEPEGTMSIGHSDNIQRLFEHHILNPIGLLAKVMDAIQIDMAWIFTEVGRFDRGEIASISARECKRRFSLHEELIDKFLLIFRESFFLDNLFPKRLITDNRLQFTLLNLALFYYQKYRRLDPRSEVTANYKKMLESLEKEFLERLKKTQTIVNNLKEVVALVVAVDKVSLSSLNIEAIEIENFNFAETFSYDENVIFEEYNFERMAMEGNPGLVDWDDLEVDQIFGSDIFELQQAIKDREFERAEKLLEKGNINAGNINRADRDGRTVLHHLMEAFKEDDPSVPAEFSLNFVELALLERILLLSPDINQEDNNGNTPLSLARDVMTATGDTLLLDQLNAYVVRREEEGGSSSAKQQCLENRKRRLVGLSCLDSNDKEEMDEKEKKELIQTLFQSKEMKSVADKFVQLRKNSQVIKNSEFYQVLHKIVGKASKGEQTDADINDLIAKVNDIDLASLDPAVIDIIRQIQEAEGDTERVNHIITKPEVWEQVRTATSWLMRTQMLGNIMGNLAEGDVKTAMSNSAVIVGDAMIAEAMSGLTPITWYFMVNSVVDDFRRLSEGDTSTRTLVKTALDEGILASSITALANPELGPVVEALMLGEIIWLAVERVDEEDTLIHLTPLEKLDEGIRGFFGMSSEKYILALMSEKQANTILTQAAFDFLKKHPEIRSIVFPSGKLVSTDKKNNCHRECRFSPSGLFSSRKMICKPVCDDETVLQIDENNSIWLDRKEDNIYLRRSRPDRPNTTTELFCLPSYPSTCSSMISEICPNGRSSDMMRDYDDIASVAHLCINAIGLSLKENTGNYTFIALDNGNDTAYGPLEAPSIILVKEGNKQFYGGDEDDEFILIANKTTGILDGRGGTSNKLDLAQFALLADHLRVNAITDSLSSSDYSRDESLAVKNIQHIYGRENKTDHIACSCYTQYVDGRGGKDFTSPDIIIVPPDCPEDARIKVVFRPNTRLLNRDLSGRVDYIIPSGPAHLILSQFPGQGQIDYTANFNVLFADRRGTEVRKHPVRNNYYNLIFTYPLADLVSINLSKAESCITFNFKRGTNEELVYSKYIGVDTLVVNCRLLNTMMTINIKNEDITIQHVTNKYFDSLDEIVGDYLPLTQQYHATMTVATRDATVRMGKAGSIAVIMKADEFDIADRTMRTWVISYFLEIANRLNATITFQSPHNAMVIGHGGHEIFFSDPKRHNYFLGNGGENVYIINLPKVKREMTHKVMIYPSADNRSIDSLDLCQLAGVTKKIEVFNQFDNLFIRLRIKDSEGDISRTVIIKIRDGVYWHRRLHVYVNASVALKFKRRRRYLKGQKFAYWRLKPIPALQNAAVILTNLFRVYRPNQEQDLEIYHNQPTITHQIGVVDLGDKLLSDFEIKMTGSNLVLSTYDYAMIIANWKYSPEAREMLFVFNGSILNTHCVAAGCGPEHLITEFDRIKTAQHPIINSSNPTEDSVSTLLADVSSRNKRALLFGINPAQTRLSKYLCLKKADETKRCQWVPVIRLSASSGRSKERPQAFTRVRIYPVTILERLSLEAITGMLSGFTHFEVDQFIRYLEQRYPDYQGSRCLTVMDTVLQASLSSAVSLVRYPISGPSRFAEDSDDNATSLGFYFGTNLCLGLILKSLSAGVDALLEKSHLSQTTSNVISMLISYSFYFFSLGMLLSSKDFEQNPCLAASAYLLKVSAGIATHQLLGYLYAREADQSQKNLLNSSQDDVTANGSDDVEESIPANDFFYGAHFCRRNSNAFTFFASNENIFSDSSTSDAAVFNRNR